MALKPRAQAKGFSGWIQKQQKKSLECHSHELHFSSQLSFLFSYKLLHLVCLGFLQIGCYPIVKLPSNPQLTAFIQFVTKVYSVWLRGLLKWALSWPRWPSVSKNSSRKYFPYIYIYCIVYVHWEGRLSPSLTRSTWLIQGGSKPDIVLSKSYWFWVQHKRRFNPTKKTSIVFTLRSRLCLKSKKKQIKEKIKENSVHELLAFLTVQEAEESQSRSRFSSLFLLFLRKRWCCLL